MIRQLCAVLLMIGWAGSAGAGETACRVLGTITFEVGKTVCIPGMRKDWLVCTDRSAPTGGGSWKDTGVPCREPQPHRPRDYRQVAEGPHPAPAPAEVKRVIDLFRGVVFRCVPSAGLDWTTGACKSITDEFVSEVKVARLATVVIDAGDDDATKRRKAEAAGLPLDNAVDWQVWFAPADDGAVLMKESVRAVLEVVPGIYDWRPLLLPSDAFFHPDEANAKHALAEAKADFGGEIKYLLEER